MKKIICSFVVLILITMFSQGTALSKTAPTSAKPLTIKSLSNPTVTVKQNTPYSLPKTLISIMSNKSKKSVAVTWNKKSVTTGIVGTSYFYGKVNGYKKQIRLTLKIIPIITAIEDINVTVNQNEQYILPTNVEAMYSNNVAKSLPVIWNTQTASTEVPGDFEFLGRIDGYSKGVKLNLTVSPIISNIPDLNISVKQYEGFIPPQKVTAEFSDGTKQNLDVQWETTEINTAADGNFSYKGTVYGYSKPVILNLMIIPVKIISINGINGNVIVKLSNAPSVPPVASDFLLTETIEASQLASSATDITSIKADSTDSSGTTYIISYDPIKPGFEDKSAIIGISYKGGTSLNSAAFSIPMANNADKNIDTTINSQQQFYNAIKYSLMNFNDSIELSIKNYNDKDYDLKIIDKVIYEHPDINYSYRSCSTSYSSPNSSGYSRYLLKFNYILTKDKMLEERNAVNNRVKEIIEKTITPGMTEYQKELALHDYVIKNSDYDKRIPNEPAESHNPYGVLVLGTGVCDSYAKAMFIILNDIGIETKYVIGDANNGTSTEGHAWNMVKLDGEWYHLDATFDDPVMTSSNSIIGHDYFNITDGLILKNHTIDKSVLDYPLGTATKYNFFNMRGPEYDSSGNPMIFINNKSEFTANLSRVLNNRGTSISMVLLNNNTESYNVQSTITAIVSRSYALRYNWQENTNSADQSIKYIELNFTY